MDLNSQILEAHANGKKSDLVALYSQAADATKDNNEKCFFWVQAYVFALETNNKGAQRLHALLKEYGRES